MSAAAKQFAIWLITGKSERALRRQRRRHGWRRHFRRLLVNLSFGFLLVGCAGQSVPFVRSSSVEDPVLVLRNSNEPNQRLAAYRALGSEADGPLHQNFAGLLLVDGIQKESSALARAAAARSMGRYNLPEVRQALEEAVSDKSPMVRAEACSSLGKVAGADAIEILAKRAHEDEDSDVRIAATRAMAQLNDPRCNEHLLMCLRDKDIVVADLASQGLRQNSGTNLGPSFDDWEQYLANGVAPEGAERVVQQPPGIFGRILR